MTVPANRRYPLLVLVAVMAGSVLSYAQMGVDDARLIPYSGKLRSAGVNASGDYWMRFGLFATAGESDACLLTDPTTCPIWGEEQLVTVSSGEFSVALGEANAIVDADIAGNGLFLSIAVKGAADTDFAIVGAKQQLLAVPWAARAATATDYQITGGLTVGGNADVGGSLKVGAVSNASVPAGAVMFFRLASCPVGWAEMTALRGRYAVGLPSGGTLSQTVGQALTNAEDRPAGKHTHKFDDTYQPLSTFAYWHNASGTYGNSQAVQALTSAVDTTDSGDGLIAGTNAPYVQLLACEKQ